MDLLQELREPVHVPVLEEHLGFAHLVVRQLGCLQDLTTTGKGMGHILITN